MRLFRRLIYRVIPVVAPLLLAGMIPYSSAQAAGPDPSLCSFTASRLNLPPGFPLNVCWDGSQVVIKNTTPFVVHISLSGDVGTLSRTSVDGDAAGALIAATETNPAVLPPEYQLTVHVGSGGGSFAVQGNSDNVTYAKLRALEGFVPGNVFADYEAISGFAGELSDDSSEYAQCMAGSNFIEAAACSASFAWNVNFAVDRLAVETGVQLFRHSLSLGALLNLINTALWAKGAVSSILDLRDSPRSFSISPVSAPPAQSAPPGGETGSSPTTPSGSGGSSSPSGPGGVASNGSISIAWGSNPAPAGDWMDVTFTNFPTGPVTWYCVEGGTSYGPYSTTLTSSTETLTTNTCYDTEAGDSDYFTAEGIDSNTIPAD